MKLYQTTVEPPSQTPCRNWTPLWRPHVFWQFSTCLQTRESVHCSGRFQSGMNVDVQYEAIQHSSLLNRAENLLIQRYVQVWSSLNQEIKWKNASHDKIMTLAWFWVIPTRGVNRAKYQTNTRNSTRDAIFIFMCSLFVALRHHQQNWSLDDSAVFLRKLPPLALHKHMKWKWRHCGR